MTDELKQFFEEVLTEQCGQTKPLMFSTIPRIRTPVFLQKVISLLTSPVDTACSQYIADLSRKLCFVFYNTSQQIDRWTELWLVFTWGVVTKMAPSTLCFFRFSSTAKCSSEVPGGVSTSSTSSSPHATSDTNWPIKAAGRNNQTWREYWAWVCEV